MAARSDRPALWRGSGKRSVQAATTPGAEPVGASWTDAAKELADSYGIDIGTVAGTGKDGNVTKADVQAAYDAQD